MVASDGFTEQVASSGEFFGEQRLIESLTVASIQQSSLAFGTSVFDSLGAFANGCGQDDDRTLFVLEAVRFEHELREVA